LYFMRIFKIYYNFICILINILIYNIFKFKYVYNNYYIFKINFDMLFFVIQFPHIFLYLFIHLLYFFPYLIFKLHYNKIITIIFKKFKTIIF
jgi:hypothetical protein